MPFCPTCRTEYTGQVESCEICMIGLVDSLSHESEEGMGNTELVELAIFPNVSEAEMIKEILEKSGVQTIQRGEVDPIGIASGAEAVALLVEKRDLLRAQEFYEAYFARKDPEESQSDPD